MRSRPFAANYLHLVNTYCIRVSIMRLAADVSRRRNGSCDRAACRFGDSGEIRAGCSGDNLSMSRHIPDHFKVPEKEKTCRPRTYCSEWLPCSIPTIFAYNNFIELRCMASLSFLHGVDLQS
jgi:hypothetical protein